MRKRLLSMVGTSLTVIILCNCAGDNQRSIPAQVDLSSLIDSVSRTPAKSGKFSLAWAFFEELANLGQAEGEDSARSVLIHLFSHLHSKIRVTDSLAVLQIVEWIYNCFTMMDSGGVFFVNGAADTYAAWYLQQVEGVRPDLTVISLQFLVGADYRQFLLEDKDIRTALNLSRHDSLPTPPSTGETQDALAEMITRLIKIPEHPPVYVAPRCGIEDRFDGHLVDLGLVYVYQDIIRPQDENLDLLISKLTQDWKLGYASQGPPKDSSYAARIAWLQYLTLLIRMAPEFEKAKRYSDMDTLFVRLEPVVGEDWRFSMLRFMVCHQRDEECRKYLDKVKKYAAEHPDDRAVQAALQQLEKEQH